MSLDICSGLDQFSDCDELLNWLLVNPENDDHSILPHLENDDQSSSSLSDAETPAFAFLTNSFNFEQYFDPAAVHVHNNAQEEKNDSSYIFRSTNIAGSLQVNEQSPIRTQWEDSGFNYDYTNTNTIGTGKRKRKDKDNKHEEYDNQELPELQTNQTHELSKMKKPCKEIEEMERRITDLEKENEELNDHFLNVARRTTEIQKKRFTMEKLMAEKMMELGDSDYGDQSELSILVSQYTEIYADYGKYRQREITYHLNQLEKLLTPTQTTKMFLWTLQQDKKFFESEKSPLFDILSKELGIKPEQAQKMQERRPRVKELLVKLRESFKLITALRTAISHRHENLDLRCTTVQQNCTAKQTVQFLIWISRNVRLLTNHIPDFSRSSAGHTSNPVFSRKI